MTLKDKSTLEAMIGKSWMYRGATSTFNDMVETTGFVIISTSQRAIKVPEDQVAKFIQDCLPAESPAEKGVAKLEIDGQVISDLTTGMMKAFKDLDEAGPDQLKMAIQKAQAKTNVCNSVMGIATALMKVRKMRS
jgi:hypothetical protein